MNKILQSHAAMLCFSILIAGSFSFGSMIANDISPIALTAVRFGLAACIMGLIAFFTKTIIKSAILASWRYFILGGTFSLYFVLMFEGLKSATPISAAAVFTLMPAISSFLGFVILKQKIRLYGLAAIIIGTMGSLWVVFRADIVALVVFKVGTGELIYFLGCIAHAFLPILFRKLNRGENAIMVTFGMLASGTVILSVYGAADIFQTNWKALTPFIWGTIVYLAVFATSLSFLCMQFASIHLPATNVMAYTYLTPIWVLVLERILQHETPPIWISGGVILSIVSVIILLCTSLKSQN
ncbi:DMT family transporter [Planktomarina sp.]|nr:DMT family transporter [Planktomarina sp.]MDB4841688.1 DMT family transporter [Planktomarina sp.]